MKLAVCAVLLAAWCGAGCVTNIGGKVALIADYETAPGEPGGAFRLRTDGNERHLLLPALVLSILMLSFNLLGDGLRDAIDPQMRSM